MLHRCPFPEGKTVTTFFGEAKLVLAFQMNGAKVQKLPKIIDKNLSVRFIFSDKKKKFIAFIRFSRAMVYERLSIA